MNTQLKKQVLTYLEKLQEIIGKGTELDSTILEVKYDADFFEVIKLHKDDIKRVSSVDINDLDDDDMKVIVDKLSESILEVSYWNILYDIMNAKNS